MKTESELLKEECEINDLPFCGIEKTFVNFYEILFSVISKKQHEKKKLPEGIILSNRDLAIKNGKVIKNYVESTSDGETCFRYEINGFRRTIIFDLPVSQKNLLDMVSNNDAKVIIIIKMKDETRVYYKGIISIHENRRWVVTPSLNSLLQSLQIVSNGRSSLELVNLLSYAYYELSLNKIGCTIVYIESRLDRKYYNNGEDLHIQFQKPFNKVILKNYLQSHDGAIIMDKNFWIRKGNVFLDYNKNSLKKIDNYSGTRHTSAACFSLEHKRVVVFVVSDDGGVSVFWKGKKIEELYVENAISQTKLSFFERMEKLASLNDEIMDGDSEQITCANCGTHYHLQFARITGFNDKEDILCHKCGYKMDSKFCYDYMLEEE